MSEYENPARLQREPTLEDLRQLMGASTPHFALHLRERIRTLIAGLAPDDPVRVEGEREIARLNEVALGGERRGAGGTEERGMPSLRGGDPR